MNGGIGLVDLVEEQEARNLLIFELAQDQLQLRDLLLVHLADHDRRVDRRQRRAHVVDEFDRARAIDEGVGLAHEGRGGDREFDAHAVVARFLAGVADGGSRIDRALALDRAGAREDRLEQRGLAALERAHQRDAPWTRGSCAVLCHIRLPGRPRCGLVGTGGPDNHRFKPKGGLARGVCLWRNDTSTAYRLRYGGNQTHPAVIPGEAVNARMVRRVPADHDCALVPGCARRSADDHDGSGDDQAAHRGAQAGATDRARHRAHRRLCLAARRKLARRRTRPEGAAGRDPRLSRRREPICGRGACAAVGTSRASSWRR